MDEITKQIKEEFVAKKEKEVINSLKNSSSHEEAVDALNAYISIKILSLLPKEKAANWSELQWTSGWNACRDSVERSAKFLAPHSK